MRYLNPKESQNGIYVELPDLTNKNKNAQLNLNFKKMIFLKWDYVSVKYWEIFTKFHCLSLKFKYNWMSCILSDNPAYLGS